MAAFPPNEPDQESISGTVSKNHPMKTFNKNALFLPALIASLGWLLAGPATAQTFTTLHSFNGAPGDSGFPSASLLLSGNILYGTATGGGIADNNGTVFKVTTDGTSFTNLHFFTALAAGSTNRDGAFPYAGVILSGNTLYGTAQGGGDAGKGTVFRVNTDGTSFTNLHSFSASGVNYSYFETNSDGIIPIGSLVLSGNTLYGTAYQGGISGQGTIFKVNTDGTVFTILHSFSAASQGADSPNSDGRFPSAGLILCGDNLYGTASQGGSSGSGTVFVINTSGAGFTVLHNFSASSEITPGIVTNSDGVNPSASLVLSGNTLYGTAYVGGSAGFGTVFAVNTNGTGFKNLRSFSTAGLNSAGDYTNSDGAGLNSSLVLSGNTLYGVAQTGGSAGLGTLFALNTDGSGFANLHTFTARIQTNALGFYTNSDGAYPYAGLILSGNTLYGTASEGGSAGNGTVFSLAMPLPQLTIVRSGTNVILTWPTNFAAFTLQATTNLASTIIWSNVSPASVVVSGQNTVTNSISSANKFYRLSQ